MLLPASVNGRGPAVLLLHGQPGRREDWTPVRDLLAREHRVIAPDRPGYGQAAPLGAMGFEANADLAAELVDSLGAVPAVVAGHSWGAGVALVMAIRHPRLVRALALVSPVSPATRFGPLDRALADRRLGPPLVHAGLAAGAGALGGLARLGAGRMPRAETAWLAATAADWRSARTRQSFLVEQRELVERFPAFAARLGDARAPASVMSGARDRMASPADARRLADALPHGRLVPFQHAGHLLPQRLPAAVAREIALLAG